MKQAIAIPTNVARPVATRLFAAPANVLLEGVGAAAVRLVPALLVPLAVPSIGIVLGGAVMAILAKASTVLPVFGSGLDKPYISDRIKG